ncbi:hypothetical protein STIUS_v1c04230 [Spiroplasma sp. TIUS-1]|uniref:hypothetical protein n=1 Tax=Spiroplasma sp. TIUS-1 TaxID=216963 RepID=UPI001397A2D5|nr:hypothetical protein [Spiroplasma sp. TIUS-1]QHX35977.1 hypothetical protein STIUS_v1c04230 [Spiroplasma sp. TIUS-1]
MKIMLTFFISFSSFFVSFLPIANTLSKNETKNIIIKAKPINNNGFINYQNYLGLFLYLMLDEKSKNNIDLVGDSLEKKYIQFYQEACKDNCFDEEAAMEWFDIDFFKSSLMMIFFLNSYSYGLKNLEEASAQIFSRWIFEGMKKTKTKHWEILNIWFLDFVPYIFKNKKKIVDGNNLNSPEKIKEKRIEIKKIIINNFEANKNKYPKINLEQKTEKIFIRSNSNVIENSEFIENSSTFNNLIGMALHSSNTWQWSKKNYKEEFLNFNYKHYEYLNIDSLNNIRFNINNYFFEELEYNNEQIIIFDNYNNQIKNKYNFYELMNIWNSSNPKSKFDQTNISKALKDILNNNNNNLLEEWNKFKKYSSLLQMGQDTTYDNIIFAFYYISEMVSLMEIMAQENNLFWPINFIKRISIYKSDDSSSSLGTWLSSNWTMEIHGKGTKTILTETKINNNNPFLGDDKWYSFDLTQLIIHESGHFFNDLFTWHNPNLDKWYNYDNEDNIYLENDKKLKQFGYWGSEKEVIEDFNVEDVIVKKEEKIDLSDLNIKTYFDNSNHNNKFNFFQKIYNEIDRKIKHDNLNKEFDNVYELIDVYWKDGSGKEKLINEEFFQNFKWTDNEFKLLAKTKSDFVFNQQSFEINIQNYKKYEERLNLSEVDLFDLGNNPLVINQNTSFEEINENVKNKFIETLYKEENIAVNKEDFDISIYTDNEYKNELQSNLSNINKFESYMYLKVIGKSDKLYGSLNTKFKFNYEESTADSKINLDFIILIFIIGSTVLIITISIIVIIKKKKNK